MVSTAPATTCTHASRTAGCSRVPGFGAVQHRGQLHLGERLVLAAPDPTDPAERRAEIRPERLEPLVVGVARAHDARARLQGLDRLRRGRLPFVSSARSHAVAWSTHGSRPSTAERLKTRSSPRSAASLETVSCTTRPSPSGSGRRMTSSSRRVRANPSASAPAWSAISTSAVAGQDRHALDPVIREIRGRLAVEPGLVRGLCGGEAAGEKRVTAPGRGRDLAGRQACRRRTDASQVRVALPGRRRQGDPAPLARIERGPAHVVAALPEPPASVSMAASAGWPRRSEAKASPAWPWASRVLAIAPPRTGCGPTLHEGRASDAGQRAEGGREADRLAEVAPPVLGREVSSVAGRPVTVDTIGTDGGMDEIPEGPGPAGPGTDPSGGCGTRSSPRGNGWPRPDGRARPGRSRARRPRPPAPSGGGVDRGKASRSLEGAMARSSSASGSSTEAIRPSPAACCIRRARWTTSRARRRARAPRHVGGGDLADAVADDRGGHEPPRRHSSASPTCSAKRAGWANSVPQSGFVLAGAEHIQHRPSGSARTSSSHGSIPRGRRARARAARAHARPLRALAGEHEGEPGGRRAAGRLASGSAAAASWASSSPRAAPTTATRCG